MYDDILRIKKNNRLLDELESEELKRMSFYREDSIVDREGLLNDRGHKGHEPREDWEL